ncbi:hypothetical protein [Methanolacinia petrolearia]|uniref:hypothetical protein n=1 Tax=Methanolacinia petrolearia TaxID=54120 RepID=UPI003BAA1C1D
MELTGVARGLDRVIYIILFLVLVFFSLMNLFVFIINWETWFFGIRLAGLNAGILLFIYFLVPAVLAHLLYMYPGKTAIISILSVFFFGFTFISSSITTLQLSNGVKSFNGFMAIFLVISLDVLAGHLIAGRFYDRKEYYKENANEGGVSKTDLEGVKGKADIRYPDPGYCGVFYSFSFRDGDADPGFIFTDCSFSNNDHQKSSRYRRKEQKGETEYALRPPPFCNGYNDDNFCNFIICRTRISHDESRMNGRVDYPARENSYNTHKFIIRQH